MSEQQQPAIPAEYKGIQIGAKVEHRGHEDKLVKSGFVSHLPTYTDPGGLDDDGSYPTWDFDGWTYGIDGLWGYGCQGAKIIEPAPPSDLSQLRSQLTQSQQELARAILASGEAGALLEALQAENSLLMQQRDEARARVGELEQQNQRLTEERDDARGWCDNQTELYRRAQVRENELRALLAEASPMVGELREKYAQTVPGNWEEYAIGAVETEIHQQDGLVVADGMVAHDSGFICATRNNLPALLAMVERIGEVLRNV